MSATFSAFCENHRRLSRSDIIFAKSGKSGGHWTPFGPAALGKPGGACTGTKRAERFSASLARALALTQTRLGVRRSAVIRRITHLPPGYQYRPSLLGRRPKGSRKHQYGQAGRPRPKSTKMIDPRPKWPKGHRPDQNDQNDHKMIRIDQSRHQVEDLTQMPALMGPKHQVFRPGADLNRSVKI